MSTYLTVTCPTCGWRGEWSGETCPNDGTTLQASDWDTGEAPNPGGLPDTAAIIQVSEFDDGWVSES